MADKIQMRRGSAAAWALADPTLDQGEPGYELDTGFLKFGDGVTAYSSLPYFASGATSLDGLSDVAITAPASGQVVRYNGSTFVNAAIAAGDLPTGIDATKIGGGAVDNTEFGYLNGVTSAIQTQIDGKAASSHMHAAADIASGTLALAQGGAGANLSGTGPGFLKQATLGAAVTVATLVAADIPNLDASKITSGQLALAQGGTAADLSATGGSGKFLKQASAGAAVTVATVTLSDLDAGTLPNATVLTFPSGQTGSATDRQIYGNASGLNYNAPSGLAHLFGRNGTTLVTLGINGVTFNSTSGITTAGNYEISCTSGGLYANVATGKEFRVQVNASSHYRFSGSNFSIENNMYLKFVSTAATVTGSEKSLVPTSAGMVLNTPSSSSVALAVNATAVATFAAGSITLADATNIVVNSTTGTKFPSASTGKWGAWGATPVAQQTGPTALSSRTAGASYTATEQTMIQEAHDTARLTLALMRTIGLAA